MLYSSNITQTTLKIIGLYTNDYAKSLHIREIARKISVDVKSVQIQLYKLEKFNVLSSIRRGKNKEFSLNRDMVTRYYLVMAECFATVAYLRKHFLIKKMLAEIEPHVKGTVIMFGSHTKGTSTKQSDIDLFVMGDRVDRRAILRTSDTINRDIDVQYSTRQQFLGNLRNNDPLAREIVSSHIVLKGVDEFCQIMWSDYTG